MHLTWLWCLVLIIHHVCSQTVPPALRQLVESRESAVRKLKADAEVLQGQRCFSAVRECNTCTQNSCNQYEMQGSSDVRSCVTDFGTPRRCNDGSGQRLMMSESKVRFAAETSSSPAILDDICTWKALDTSFVDNNQTHSSLRWQYLGSQTGVFRQYPGHTWDLTGGACSAYDPRIRPWYIAASSGPKNVMLIIDVSGSMTTQNRLEVAIDAAKAVLNTLTTGDSFGLVAFSSSAVKYRSQMQFATAENVRLAEAWIGRLSAGGGTQFTQAFTAAFDMLEASQAAETATSCTSVFLFLTDGIPSDANSPQAIQTRQQARDGRGQERVFIFTYALGSQANLDIPKQIACENTGVFEAIPGMCRACKLQRPFCSSPHSARCGNTRLCATHDMKYVPDSTAACPHYVCVIFRRYHRPRRPRGQDVRLL